MYHTEVPVAYRGQGIAKFLVKVDSDTIYINITIHITVPMLPAYFEKFDF